MDGRFWITGGPRNDRFTWKTLPAPFTRRWASTGQRRSRTHLPAGHSIMLNRLQEPSTFASSPFKSSSLELRPLCEARLGLPASLAELSFWRRKEPLPFHREKDRQRIGIR